MNDFSSPNPVPEQFTTAFTFSSRLNASSRLESVHSLIRPPFRRVLRRRYAQYSGEFTTNVLYLTPHLTPSGSWEASKTLNPSRWPYATSTEAGSRYSRGGASRYSIPSRNSMPAAGSDVARFLKCSYVRLAWLASLMDWADDPGMGR